jgi:hypothetical protein
LRRNHCVIFEVKTTYKRTLWKSRAQQLPDARSKHVDQGYFHTIGDEGTEVKRYIDISRFPALAFLHLFSDTNLRTKSLKFHGYLLHQKLSIYINFGLKLSDECTRRHRIFVQFDSGERTVDAGANGRLAGAVEIVNGHAFVELRGYNAYWTLVER